MAEKKDLFSEGFNCAQSVFGEYAEDLGVPLDVASSVSAGFGSGIGRHQKFCGAISGAIMAIGTACSNESSDRSAAKSLAYERAGAFLKEFEMKHGSTECRVLIGADISTPELAAKESKKGTFASTCGPLVQSAIEMVEKYL